MLRVKDHLLRYPDFIQL
ncbi:hypothetical protein [Klebsiella pneumoniae]|nr:hypothetical protein [Klebsiella pneumoniae]MDV5545130.1 hypothetical protein [Klebsiella pneumoniae]